MNRPEPGRTNNRWRHNRDCHTSWDLSNNQIRAIAEGYFQAKGKVGLEEAFRCRFDVELPDTLNENHRLLIVGSQIDASSARIIEYLSDTYGVNINAATLPCIRK